MKKPKNGSDEPILDYALQGSELDLLTEQVLALKTSDRLKYIDELLEALARVSNRDELALKKRVPFAVEMRDLRRLLYSPADIYLFTDDSNNKRNCLGKGSPGASHTYWSRNQMWRMITKIGDLAFDIETKDRRLVSKLSKLFDPSNQSKKAFQKIGKSAILTALSFLEFDRGTGSAFPPFTPSFLLTDIFRKRVRAS